MSRISVIIDLFIKLIMITYLCFLDLQGFKLFLKLTWEPFEEQFKSIETRFLNNAEIIIRLVIVHSADTGHQYHAYNKGTQERQEGDYYSNNLSVLITIIITYTNLGRNR